MNRKNGFTIVEIMVVMAIMAVMSVLGVAAIINANSAAMIDKEAEALLSDIREAQNKSFSVASDPDDDSIFPVAWGVRVTKSTNQYKRFRITYTAGSPGVFDYQEYGDAVSGPFTVKEITGGLDNVYFVYAAPFGKYYASNTAANPCDAGGSNCAVSPVKPKDMSLTSALSANRNTVTIEYRNNRKVITVEENGESRISQ